MPEVRPHPRTPAGPRGRTGAAAEDAADRYLRALGWRVIARNVRLGRDELDIVALAPGADGDLVIVEVRSSSSRSYGDPVEWVDAAKVRRLYRAAARLRDSGAVGRVSISRTRIDLLVLQRRGGSGWEVTAHLRGLEPP